MTRRLLFCGTFDSPDLYLLAFNEETNELRIAKQFQALGSHSWLALSASNDRLYATCWTTPPGVAAYSITEGSEPEVTLLNFQETKARSGYITVSPKMCYSAGGSTGEAFRLDPESGALQPSPDVQSYLDAEDQKQIDSGSVMDFGGLRHGAHSADLSPDGKTLYVADIGRNCIWTLDIDAEGRAWNRQKFTATRSNDGPRHAWPHPNGKIVYSLQEHSNMVDAFQKTESGFEWRQGVRILPQNQPDQLFWADEVRLSLSNNSSPKHLFASTRGLDKHTKGYVSVFEIELSGLFASIVPVHIWQTPTSGGWANAIEPAPNCSFDAQLVALTDSEEGFVSVLKFDGQGLSQLAKVKLPRGGAATAVWYR